MKLKAAALFLLVFAVSLYSVPYAEENTPASATVQTGAPAAQAETNPMALVAQGKKLIKSGDLDAAVETLKNAAALGTEQNNGKAVIFARLLLDKIYGATGAKEQAVLNLEKLVGLLKGMTDKQAMLNLKIGNLCIETGDFAKAVKHFKLAKDNYAELGDDSKSVYIDNSMALAYSSMGEYAQAEKIYNRLLEGARAEGNATNTIRLLINLGDLHKTRSEYDAAIENYTEALVAAEKNNDTAAQVNILNNICLVHQDRADLDKAQEAVDRAKTIAENNGDKRGMAATLHQQGILLMHKGDVDAAIESYKESIKLKDELNDSSIGNTYAELGRAYYFRGNYKQARFYYREALKAKPAVDVEITVNNNLAMVFKMQGMLEYALEEFRQSLEKARQFNLRYQKSFLFNNIGVVEREMGNLDEALESHEQALEIDRAVGAKLDELVDINNIALVYKMKGEPQKALDMLLGVLDQAEGLGSYDDYVRTLVNLADVYVDLEKYEDALEYYRKAAEISRKILSKERLWNALYGIGRTLSKTGDAGGAIDAFKKAVDVIEELRANIGGGGEEKSFFLVDKVKVYKELIILLFKHGDFGEALDYLERMKSRSLLEMIQQGKAKIDKGLTPEETEKEKQLKVMLAKAAREMAAALAAHGVDSEEALAAKDNLEQVRMQQNLFKEKLYLDHPRLAFARGENKPVSTAIVQDFLRNDEVIVVYMLDEPTSYAWTVTTDAVRMYDLGVSATKINFTVDKKLREALEKGVWGSSQERAAKKLYKMILKPLEGDFEGKTIMGVLPDGRLYELPFYLLKDSKKKDLIDRFAIYYLPSLSVMVETRKAKASLKNENKVLAFGNPKFERPDLVQLPGTENEVGKIAEIYGDRAQVYLHENALEEQIKYHGRDYRIIHMASHGLMNNHNPMFSSIAMSQIKDQDDDGYLEAREITNIDLDAELVIMSACESGRGKLRPGEGILGLTRSFFSSGIPSVIASMWSVNDLATAFMMQHFYENFQSMNAVEAMRKAQIATRDEIGDNPNLWAPFVIMGYGVEKNKKQD